MKKATVKKVLLVAMEVLLVAILLLNVTTAILSAVDLRTRLGWMPYAALTVEGGSMDPELQGGDLIIVRREAYEALAVGDDITFMTTAGLVTHRIVDVRGGEYVTRGLDNEMDDVYTVSAEEYCGKVVASVPVLGHVVRFLSSSDLALALCVLLILTICFGGWAVRKLKNYAKGEEKQSRGSLPRRILACCCALSMLFCMPYMTDAKYIGQINRFDMAVALPLHFSSNYLSVGAGNNYSIQGWDGKIYPFDVYMRNYDNELLFNDDNVDVRYGIGIKMCTDAGLSTDYELQIELPQGAAALEDFVYPDSWNDKNINTRYAYTLEGGQKNSQLFRIRVVPKLPVDADGEPIADITKRQLPPGTDIKFEVYATTEKGKNYVVELKGNFEMHVAETTQFIGTRDVKEAGSMVTFNVKTNLIPGGTDERVLMFQWDPDLLYINEFESTAFNVINNHRNDLNYYNKTEGKLWMKVQAYANINLEFFKKPVEPPAEGEPAPEIDYRNAVSVTLVEKLGSSTPMEEGGGS